MPDALFWEVHSGLARQGPGDDACTARALDLAGPLPPDARILDIGCGPGAQTMTLARRTGAHITAVDLHKPFLKRLRASAQAQGLGGRIETVAASMAALPFENASFDLIWSEGAAYIMGFRAALETWRRFLKPGGAVAISEPCWLSPPDARPAGAVANWEEYPAMTDEAGLAARAEAAGYRMEGAFVLPPAAWWNYYTPMQARVAQLREKYAHAPEMLAGLRVHQQEIDSYHLYGDHFSYLFLVMRPR